MKGENYENEFLDKYNDGLSNKELAEYFDISLGTVTSRMSRLGLSRGLKNKVNLSDINYKVLDEYPNYGICDDGRVFNLKRLNVIATTKTKDNYLYVKVVDSNGKRYSKRVNRLVALSFIENADPLNKTQVNHKDLDTLNNSVDNLEWVTPSENIQHSLLYGNRSKYSIETIHFICKLLENGNKVREISILVSKKYNHDERKIIKLVEDIKYCDQWKVISKNYKIK